MGEMPSAGGLSQESLLVFMRVSEKTTENSEKAKFDKQDRGLNSAPNVNQFLQQNRWATGGTNQKGYVFPE